MNFKEKRNNKKTNAYTYSYRVQNTRQIKQCESERASQNQKPYLLLPTIKEREKKRETVRVRENKCVREEQQKKSIKLE